MMTLANLFIELTLHNGVCFPYFANAASNKYMNNHIVETKEVNFNSDIDISIRIYFQNTSDIVIVQVPWKLVIS